MEGRLRWHGWRTWLTGVVCTVSPLGHVAAQDSAAKPSGPLGPQAAVVARREPAALHNVPLQDVPAGSRERIRWLVEHSTLSARGPVEMFRGRMDLYQWLLDHPDRGVGAWRRLGTKCGDITERGNGRFGWSDGQGSDIHWDTVLRTPQVRVWLAEGSVKPGPLWPAVSVQAVAVIRCGEGRDAQGRPTIRQQGDLYLYTDSKVVALATELVGQPAQDLAAQAVGQMQLFFSAIIWYLERHPERTQTLLAAGKNDEMRRMNDERMTKHE